MMAWVRTKVWLQGVQGAGCWCRDRIDTSQPNFQCVMQHLRNKKLRFEVEITKCCP